MPLFYELNEYKGSYFMLTFLMLLTKSKPFWEHFCVCSPQYHFAPKILNGVRLYFHFRIKRNIGQLKLGFC